MAKAEAPQVDKKWQAESDLRTLRDAEEILKDPARLKAAQAEAAKQAKVLGNIRDKLAALKGD